MKLISFSYFRFLRENILVKGALLLQKYTIRETKRGMLRELNSTGGGMKRKERAIFNQYV